MKLKAIIAVLATGAMAAGCANTTEVSKQPESNPDKSSETVTFICREGFDKVSGQKLPTTYASNARGKIAVVRWETNYFSKSGYTPKERCEEVSPRLQKAYENGSLLFLAYGTMNGQPAICTSRSDGGGCDTLLITLRPNDDPMPILQQLGDTLQGRSTGPLRHSSGASQMYIQVDIKEFLESAPVD
ncbi:COP23 domain-containing protein [Kamptonema formosum]|uniref:COP23 domain-containing protein n=1 Tax=Kamptonema formosum TaxID=331992 RepID=UPI000348258B|nr:COP23 domain-containing protein [Oscillatoria sp. PCC 10802]